MPLGCNHKFRRNTKGTTGRLLTMDSVTKLMTSQHGRFLGYCKAANTNHELCHPLLNGLKVPRLLQSSQQRLVVP
jgi:hypothetical protein